jgi:hypothetical protein
MPPTAKGGYRIEIPVKQNCDAMLGRSTGTQTERQVWPECFKANGERI